MNVEFINICCSACFVDCEDTIPKDVYKDIVEIFNFYEKIVDKGVPDHLKSNFQVVKDFADLRSKGKNSEQSIDSLKACKIDQTLVTYLEGIKSRNLDTKEATECKHQIRNRKKLAIFFENYPNLNQLIKDFDNGNFQNSETFVKQYEKLVDVMHNSLSAERRKSNITGLQCLDMMNDSFDVAINDIRRNYVDIDFKVPTHYKELDRYFCGGFHPGRLYIFAGCTSDGKSTLLLNFIMNNLMTVSSNKTNKSDLYIYITMENTAAESLSRMYCTMVNKSLTNIVSDWKEEEKVFENNIKSVLKKNKTNVVISYFSPDTITAGDILTYVTNIKEQYEKIADVKGIFIDYLDKIKAGSESYDKSRYDLVLGRITDELKTIAVVEKLPVITVTQLNRSGYAEDSSPSLGQISNSIQKCMNADAVVLLKAKRDPPPGDFAPAPEEGTLDLFIQKNRGGPREVSVSLRTNFSKFLIWESNRIKELPITNISGLESKPKIVINDAGL